MYPSRISVPTPPTPETEDIFSSALASLFTDDTQNSHGTPGSSVTYHSPRFGTISLRIPAHPDVEEGRKLFAHYLWNAGVIAADAIETAGQDDSQEGVQQRDDDTPTMSATPIAIQDEEHQNQNQKKILWDKKYWDVRGNRVLELGAGTALPSIVSALSGASVTTITDHPSSPALTTGAIEQNVRDNVVKRQQQTKTGNDNADTVSLDNITTSTSTIQPNQPNEPPSVSPSTPVSIPTPITDSTSISAPDRKVKEGQGQVQDRTQVQVYGYTWGTEKMYLPNTYGKPAYGVDQPAANSYDKIIIADCLWMPSQHLNLVKTVLWYLRSTEKGQPQPEPEPSTSSPPTTISISPSTDSTVAVAVTDGSQPCALVIAGFHTGRGIVRHFFEVATGEWIDTQSETPTPPEEDGDQDPEFTQVQGQLRAAEIFEIDVNGVRRPWLPVREGETKDQAKRWCVVAVLVRR
ncbi:hypothetical protein KCU88_g4477, partial [Aureobasidium melanogenum]